MSFESGRFAFFRKGGWVVEKTTSDTPRVEERLKLEPMPEIRASSTKLYLA